MSFDIYLSKIECFGKHGIYDNEKNNDQKFLVDIYIKNTKTNINVHIY